MKITDLNYDTARLEKAKKGLARHGDNFYNTIGKLDVLLNLMNNDPMSTKITDIIEQLPWKAKSYILKNIVKIMPNGEINKLYNPTPLEKTKSTDSKIKIPTIKP